MSKHIVEMKLKGISKSTSRYHRTTKQKFSQFGFSFQIHILFFFFVFNLEPWLAPCRTPRCHIRLKTDKVDSTESAHCSRIQQSPPAQSKRTRIRCFHFMKNFAAALHLLKKWVYCLMGKSFSHCLIYSLMLMSGSACAQQFAKFCCWISEEVLSRLFSIRHGVRVTRSTDDEF